MQIKRISAPRHYPILRKAKKFTVVPKGPHKQENGLALSIIIRDVLKLADTRKEVKKILNGKEVFVDGKVRKDTYCVGLMDVISMPSIKLNYRVSVDKKGLTLKEISNKESKLKIARVTGVRTMKNGKYQINLHDGRNILSDKKYRPFTSLVISIPEQEIKKELLFEKGNLAIVFKGNHRGKISKIINIDGNQVQLKGDEEFYTIKDYVYVIGKEKEELTL